MAETGNPVRSALLKFFAYGAGTIFALATVVAVGVYVSSLPKQWAKSAIVAAYVGLTVFTGDSAELSFEYGLKNTTDRDYLFPTDSRAVFVMRPDGKGLQSDRISWDDKILIPAKQQVVVRFTVKRDYTESYPKEDKDNPERLAAFMAKQLKDIGGFRVLDTQNRYEFDLPRGWASEIKLRSIEPR